MLVTGTTSKDLDQKRKLWVVVVGGFGGVEAKISVHLLIKLLFARRLVVSIRQSRPLTKFEKMWNSPCIAIEDPFELSHNLGAGISRKSEAILDRLPCNLVFTCSEPLYQEGFHQW